MVPVSTPFTSETPPKVTELKSDTNLPLASTMPKNMAPFLDKYGSISGVEDHVVDCQSVVPARKERTMRPVGWAVLVTLAMPGVTAQAKVPRLLLVNTAGSTWQYGTMRVADVWAANPNRSLVRDTDRKSTRLNSS